ncbi:hypothetical protein AWB74_01226 [Caballeronia arvi]|uniref:Uncharacterized protein n=1 Tax=Caballeronia arvi TaxID=1777135 RepID=A0A158G8I5_9BURK|nr:hypothetical protein AWB74_01226 [Caballeronia arvi]
MQHTVRTIVKCEILSCQSPLKPVDQHFTRGVDYRACATVERQPPENQDTR